MSVWIDLIEVYNFFFPAPVVDQVFREQCIRELFIDPQTPLFSNIFIKNGSHGTIHTFKNYFATIFLVFSFSKISSIQMDPKCVLQIILKFSLNLLKKNCSLYQVLTFFFNYYKSRYTICKLFYWKKNYFFI